MFSTMPFMTFSAWKNSCIARVTTPSTFQVAWVKLKIWKTTTKKCKTAKQIHFWKCAVTLALGHFWKCSPCTRTRNAIMFGDILRCQNDTWSVHLWNMFCSKRFLMPNNKEKWFSCKNICCFMSVSFPKKFVLNQQEYQSQKYMQDTKNAGNNKKNAQCVHVHVFQQREAFGCVWSKLFFDNLSGTNQALCL